MNGLIPENPYLLLTPGPLSTSKGVRAAMLRDWCTWDADYNEGVVQKIRARLTALATEKTEEYTSVLMQGSGSFAVESVLGTAIPKTGKLLILTNGAYGKRMVEMARVLSISHVERDFAETETPDHREIAILLARDPDITHAAFVHCETTTGILNPLDTLCKTLVASGKSVIVDAMSSFGGIPFDIGKLGIDYLISSANKCVQGVPGFGFVIARRDALAGCAGNGRSLCMDLYRQWREMDNSGKWRYTSPTHVVRAFDQALEELEAEGGISFRYKRYCENHRVLVDGMRKLNFRALLPDALQSPFITSFLYPDKHFDFSTFYNDMKTRGFVLYPGKISQADTFRIGTIGEVYPADIHRLLEAVGDTVGSSR